MAIVISFAIQKGGVGKTTSSSITGYLLSQDARVLCCDFDSQGNMTYLLTQQNIYNFTDKTILQAVKEKDPRPYIHKITDNLHILTAEDFLSTLPRYIYREYKGNPNTLLKETIDVVKDEYDYIIIDCPPNLGDHTINAMTASDYCVVMLQTEPFCFDALERFLEFLQGVKDNTNPHIQLAGILSSMLDTRATLDSTILDKARSDYEDIVFNSIIKRRSRIKEFSIEGIKNSTKKDLDALGPYINFVEELKTRVKKG